MKNDTPRTDAELARDKVKLGVDGGYYYTDSAPWSGLVSGNFARQLERELAAANALTTDWINACQRAKEELAAANARAEKNERDAESWRKHIAKLEEMRGLIRKAGSDNAAIAASKERP